MPRRSRVSPTSFYDNDDDTPKRNTCTACRRAKIRCDRQSPACGRCTRLGIPCIEQMRAQGRPVSVWHEADNAVTPPTPTACTSPSLAPTVTVSRKRKLSGGSEQASKASCRRRNGMPLSALLIHNAANIMTGRFVSMHARGRADISKTAATLRCWSHRSLRLSKDSTYGALQRISKELGGQCTLGNEAEAGTTVSMDADGCISEGFAALPAGLRSLEDGSAMVACYVEDRGRVGFYMNPGFANALLSEKEALKELEEKHCLPIYLWGCLFAPESQVELFDSLAGLYFGMDQGMGEASLVLTCVARDGSHFKGLVRTRCAVECGGCASASIISIIPLPGPNAPPFPSAGSMASFAQASITPPADTHTHTHTAVSTPNTVPLESDRELDVISPAALQTYGCAYAQAHTPPHRTYPHTVNTPAPPAHTSSRHTHVHTHPAARISTTPRATEFFLPPQAVSVVPVMTADTLQRVGAPPPLTRMQHVMVSHGMIYHDISTGATKPVAPALSLPFPLFPPPLTRTKSIADLYGLLKGLRCDIAQNGSTDGDNSCCSTTDSCAEELSEGELDLGGLDALGWDWDRLDEAVTAPKTQPHTHMHMQTQSQWQHGMYVHPAHVTSLML